jgi:hypothetical protein
MSRHTGGGSFNYNALSENYFFTSFFVSVFVSIFASTGAVEVVVVVFLLLSTVVTVEVVVAAGAGVVVSTVVVVAPASVLGVPLLLAQEARNKPIVRANTLNFTNFIKVCFRCYTG